MAQISWSSLGDLVNIDSILAVAAGDQNNVLSFAVTDRTSQLGCCEGTYKLLNRPFIAASLIVHVSIISYENWQFPRD